MFGMVVWRFVANYASSVILGVATITGSSRASSCGGCGRAGCCTRAEYCGLIQELAAVDIVEATTRYEKWMRNARPWSRPICGRRMTRRETMSSRSFSRDPFQSIVGNSPAVPPTPTAIEIGDLPQSRARACSMRQPPSPIPDGQSARGSCRPRLWVFSRYAISSLECGPALAYASARRVLIESQATADDGYYRSDQKL
jgi:hypothetical protein